MTNITDARLRLIISGVIGIALTITICVMWAMGTAVPEMLTGLVTLVWGFFTGHVYTNGTGATPASPDKLDGVEKYSSVQAAADAGASPIVQTAQGVFGATNGNNPETNP